MPPPNATCTGREDGRAGSAEGVVDAGVDAAEDDASELWATDPAVVEDEVEVSTSDGLSLDLAVDSTETGFV